MADVKFYLDKRKDKDGSFIKTNVPIFLFYSFNGQRLKYFTGEHIDSKHYIDKYWELKKEPIKKTATGAENINRNLQSLRLSLETIHSNAKALGILPSVDYFKDKLNEQFKAKPSQKELSIKEALKLFLDKTKVSKAHNTFRNTQTTVNHIGNFIAKKRIQFSEIDGKFLESFKSYLINEGQLNNTVSKNLRVLRTFLNWCGDKEQGYLSDFDFKIKVKENDIDVIFLNYDEVLSLYNLEINNPSLERVRDVFVFGCFTGMRYGDIAKLQHSDIQDHQIKFRIEKAGKTKSHTVPLAPQAKAILNKYKEWPGEKALPVISNQKMNDALKEIAKLAGFDDIITIAEQQGNGEIEEKRYKKYELITCHTSRKSFITISMMLGMPESVVKSITGHSKNSKAFARYYDIVDSHKQAEINKIFGN
ncbi:MAG: phage integrase SAM-like domain-containing protein [Mucilaginibacter sp.]